MKRNLSECRLLIALGLLLAGAAPKVAEANILINGDFSDECNGWTFTDVSEPYAPGIQPFAVLEDCSEGRAEMHLYEMYGRGLLVQDFTEVHTARISFDFSGLSTSDHSAMAVLTSAQDDSLLIYCEGGSLQYFNRLLVIANGVWLIEAHMVIPENGNARLDVVGGDFVAYVNGTEVGRAAIPGGATPAYHRIGLKAAISNHIHAYIAFDNAVVESEAPCNPVVVNGAFVGGCAPWIFTDVSEPYHGSEPLAEIDCSQGKADMHLVEMYGRGLLEQAFVPIRPTRLSFDFEGLATSDHNALAILTTAQRDSLMVYCEGGAIPYFNRLLIIANGAWLIEAHMIIPCDGNARLDITTSELIAYVDDVEVGRSPIPPGLRLAYDRLGLMGAISNHIDTHIAFDNVALCGTPVVGGMLSNGDFAEACDDWAFRDLSVPYGGGYQQPYAELDCSQQRADMHLVEMYARGVIEQGFPLTRPAHLSFDFQGLATSDHNAMGILSSSEADTLMVYCEGGALSYFNRLLVWLNGSLLIEVHDVIPVLGNARLDVTESEFVAFIDGIEVGRAPIPAGARLDFNLLGLMGAISNHIDTHIAFDNVELLGWRSQEAGDQGSSREAILVQALPSVFERQTVIRLELPRGERIQVAVHDLNGRMVRLLVDETLSAGPHRLMWSGEDEYGHRAGAGVYFCRVVGEGLCQTQRVLLLR